MEGVRLGVRVFEAVFELVAPGDNVGVGVSVIVGVPVGVAEGVGVPVWLGVGVLDEVGVGLGVEDALGTMTCAACPVRESWIALPEPAKSLVQGVVPQG